MPYANGLKSAGYPKYGSVMNVFGAPINMIKSFSLVAPAGLATADGYPNGTLVSDVASQGGAPDGYYDKLLVKFHGQAQMGAVGTCAIIYQNVNLTIPGVVNNCASNNFQFSNSNPALDCRVVFKHGALITGVSGGNGSNVVLTLVNQPSNIAVGSKVKIAVGVSANLTNGPELKGAWKISAIGGNTVTLENSTGVTSPTVTGTGGPDIQSECVCAVPGIAWSFANGQTYSNFSNLVFCKLEHETFVDAGKQVDPDYTAQLKALGCKWLRTMDATGLQGNWEQDWSARRSTSFIAWAAGTRNSNYYVGTITNSGSDAYTCSAPTITSTGAYKNGEIIIGVMSGNHSTGLPTLNVNGRGAKRVIQAGVNNDIVIPSPAGAAGQSMAYTFTASWLPSGSVVLTYVTQKIATISGAANNGSGKVRLTVDSSAGYTSDQQYLIAGVVGTTEANNSGNRQSVIVIDPTHIDLPGINFSNAYVSGGTVTPPFGDDTVSAGNLMANMSSWFNQSARPTNGYVNFRSGAVYTLTQQKGALTISYSGTPTSTLRTLPVLDGDGNPYFGTGTRTCTFIYNYILDAWLVRIGGLIQSVPFEYYAELANDCNASIYHNWPILSSGRMVTSVTNFFRLNLNPGLRFGTEVGNEMWNFGLEPWAYAVSLGYHLGLGEAAKYDNGASYSYTAARTLQFADLSIAEWTISRPRKDHYILAMSAQWDIGSTDQYMLGGQFMNDPTYLAYGGLDGTAGSTNAASDYSAEANSLGSKIDGFGIAPYYGSSYLAGDTGGSGFNTNTLGGTVLQNAPLFVAANKYRDANTSGAYDDLYTQLYSTSGAPAFGINLYGTYKNGNNQQVERILRRWDKYRIAAQGLPIAVLHYEGGPQFGLGNINNGTNSPTIDIPAVSNRLANNIVNSSWDISTYVTASPATISISSGTYNNSSGLITLTLAAAATIPIGIAIKGLTGTGALLADLNGGWFVNAPITSSTTLVLKGPAGKGTITITGGTLYMDAMDLATQLCGMVYNFKFSTQYYNLSKNYYVDLTTVHSGREACGAQYGYSAGQWGVFPVSWTLGTTTAYSSFQAIADFNAGK